jgi:glutathione S-transferase
VLEEHLASEKKSLKTEHVFLGGKQATHADSIVFGWYMFTRVNRKVMLDQVWAHESLPNLQQWIKSLVDTGLVNQDDLENLPRTKL